MSSWSPTAGISTFLTHPAGKGAPGASKRRRKRNRKAKGLQGGPPAPGRALEPSPVRAPGAADAGAAAEEAPETVEALPASPLPQPPAARDERDEDYGTGSEEGAYSSSAEEESAEDDDQTDDDQTDDDQTDDDDQSDQDDPEQAGQDGQDRHDDEDYSEEEDEGTEGYRVGGYHPVHVGDVFNMRYTVLKKLGWGHFSTVWMCHDEEEDRFVALKVQKSSEQYTDAAYDEVQLLQCVEDSVAKMSDEARDGVNVDAHVVKLVDSFVHRGPHGRHVCMVFEMLGDNLLTIIQHYSYKGLPVEHVRNIARQTAVGLDFLHRVCNIIHTDLKPENILLDALPSQHEEFRHHVEAVRASKQAANEASTAQNIEAIIAMLADDALDPAERKRLRKRLKKKKQKQKQKGGPTTPAVDVAEGAEGAEVAEAVEAVEEEGAEEAKAEPAAAAAAAAAAVAAVPETTTPTGGSSKKKRRKKKKNKRKNKQGGPQPPLPPVPPPGGNDDAAEEEDAEEDDGDDEAMPPPPPPDAAPDATPQAPDADTQAPDADTPPDEDYSFPGLLLLTNFSDGDADDDEEPLSLDWELSAVAEPAGAANPCSVALLLPARKLVAALGEPARPDEWRLSAAAAAARAEFAVRRVAMADEVICTAIMALRDALFESECRTEMETAAAAAAVAQTSLWEVEFDESESLHVLQALEDTLPGVRFLFHPAMYETRMSGLPELLRVVASRGRVLDADPAAGDALPLWAMDVRALLPTAWAQGTRPLGDRFAQAADLLDESVERRRAGPPPAEPAGAEAEAEADAAAPSGADGAADGGKPKSKSKKSRKRGAPGSPYFADGNQPRVVVVDLGNACWANRKVSEDIQTRQYRCPEVILGAGYDCSADLWSYGCMLFELLTGDLLFDPRSSESYSRDADHLAQIIELLGPMPPRVALAGTYSKNFFNRRAELRDITELRRWPLGDVLRDKYGFPEAEAQEIADFLLPTLAADPAKRATAAECLEHPWLRDM